MATPFQPGSHYAFSEPIPPADTSAITRKVFDLPYAPKSPSQKLDIYWPEGKSGPFPLIIAIHGGAFMGGDKRDRQLTPMLEALKYGYAVVSINYRLSGEDIFPALVHDVKVAIRWVRANAYRLLIDVDKIAVWGSSAGGYLALMAGVTEGVATMEDLSQGCAGYRSDVQAVVSWYPPVDFTKMDGQLAESGLAPRPDQAHNGANSPESLLMGHKITEIPALVRAANPESYLRDGLPPFFIQHGTHDNVVPFQQSINFANKVRSLITGSVEHELLAGARHADPLFESPQNLVKVFTFLNRVFRR